MNNNTNYSEKEILDILSDAIGDVGYWSWWTSDLPHSIHIEFNGVQLYFQPIDESKSPSSQIAIEFQNPKSVSFLSFNQENSENWPELFHNDEIDAQNIDFPFFTFNDEKLISEILNSCINIKTIFGYSPFDESFLKEKFKIVLKTQDYGIAVSGESIRILSHDGHIKLDSIPELNELWWEYWKRYWEMTRKGTPLPKDYACEVTIPAGEN